MVSYCKHLLPARANFIPSSPIITIISDPLFYPPRRLLVQEQEGSWREGKEVTYENESARGKEKGQIHEGDKQSSEA